MTAFIGRRGFNTLLGGAAIAWPHLSFAQRNDKVRRVGVLANEPWPPLFGLRDGLGELGYIEKQNMICSSVNLLLRMSVSRRNGLYPNLGHLRGAGQQL
jgi:hypothetical protein